MDPGGLRAEYGRRIKMIGGFDKRIVAAGKAAIDAEFKRLKPVIREGGYLPAIDHSVSADISWDAYRYFVEACVAASGG
jgi:uroporphyrinogen decarboxylase